jgi:hypothetical protein
VSAAALAALAELENALVAERNALLARDVDALGRAGAAKLAALRAALAACGRSADATVRERIRALDELNRANGTLLAKRRSDVAWTLRALGLGEAACAYDAQGGIGGIRYGRVKTEA